MKCLLLLLLPSFSASFFRTTPNLASTPSWSFLSPLSCKWPEESENSLRCVQFLLEPQLFQACYVDPSTICDTLLEAGICASASIVPIDDKYFLTDDSFDVTGRTRPHASQAVVVELMCDRYITTATIISLLAGYLFCEIDVLQKLISIRDIDINSNTATSANNNISSLATIDHLDIFIAHHEYAIFGDGRHSTTRLCLAALRRTAVTKALLMLDAEKRRSLGTIFDIGAGTGILGIAAIKHGFGPVYAVEIDNDARQVIAENCHSNGIIAINCDDLCKEQQLREGSLERTTVLVSKNLPRITKTADVIVSNIPSNTILKLAPGIVEHIRSQNKAALLLVAGFPSSESDIVRHAFEVRGATFLPNETLYEAGWVLLSFSVGTDKCFQ